MNHAHGLVPEHQVLPVADGTRYGADVGGAAVVRIMASIGPGRGIGFSITPTLPIPCITKQVMVLGVS